MLSGDFLQLLHLLAQLGAAETRHPQHQRIALCLDFEFSTRFSVACLIWSACWAWALSAAAVVWSFRRSRKVVTFFPGLLGLCCAARRRRARARLHAVGGVGLGDRVF